MPKQSQRHWVGYLSHKDNSSLVLYHRQLYHHSESIVFLYHYATNQIIKHDKKVVKHQLRPLYHSVLYYVL